MARYGMVIDLNRCVRCRTCYVECKRAHNILAHPRDTQHPYEYYRLRYVEWETGTFPSVKRGFIPLQCLHCVNPICAAFCPTNAIVIGKDGLISLDREQCNGCGACANVCPYGALYIDHEGKADLCDFCFDRIKRGMVPACVEMCPAGARVFGDLNHSDSTISKIITSKHAKPLLLKGQLNDRIFYIASRNEDNWDDLDSHENFQTAMDMRKRDLPPVKGIL